MRKEFLLIACLCLCPLGCQRGPDQVVDKVLTDFGIREPDEGYVSGAQRVFERLDVVGKTELKRLNQQQRHGTIKYQDEDLHGKYYKEVKVYENYYPLDAVPASRAGERGFTGYIEYSYRVHQSARKSTRAEAMAESASIPTGEEGRETYRYHFSAGGTWDGQEGEKSR